MVGSAWRTQKLNSLPSEHWQSPPGTTCCHATSVATVSAVVVSTASVVAGASVVSGALDSGELVSGGAVVAGASVAAGAVDAIASVAAGAVVPPSSSSLQATRPMRSAPRTRTLVVVRVPMVESARRGGANGRMTWADVADRVGCAGMRKAGGMREPSLLRRPLAWILVAASAAIAFLMTLAYLGAFVDPLGRLEGLPVGIVDLDEAQTAGGQTVAAGTQIADELTGAGDDRLSWRTYDTRAAAEAAVDDNLIAGFVFIPADLSARIVAIASTQGASPPATVTVVRNEGAGTLQPAVMETLAAQLENDADAAVTGQIAATLTELGLPVPPSGVASIAAPVRVEIVDRPDLGTSGGRGLTPFYVAVVVTLTGLVAATAIHIGIGVTVGKEHLELLGRVVPVARVDTDAVRRLRAELVLTVVTAVIAGSIIPWVTVGLLGAQCDRPELLVPFAILGVLAMSWLTLALLTAFGVLGDVIALLITTIFGVPSARGVYPAEALSGFFVAIGQVLPLRYLTDGFRALFFFDARWAAGLHGALVGIVVWAVVGFVLAVGSSVIAAHRSRVSTTDAIPVHVDLAPQAWSTASLGELATGTVEPPPETVDTLEAFDTLETVEPRTVDTLEPVEPSVDDAAPSGAEPSVVAGEGDGSTLGGP